MNRNVLLDILKFTMAVMVIGIHTGFLNNVSSLASYLTVNGVFRIAVPIFLIINGFYFYSVIVKKTHISWFKRLLILHIFWTIVYSCFWLDNNDFSILIVVIKNVVIGYYHLWYLPGMIGAAVVLTIMHGLPSKYLIILILLTFLLGVLIQYIAFYQIFENIFIKKLFNYNWIYRNFLLFSYPFFCIGYLINKHTLHKCISINQAGLMSVAGLGLLAGESYLNHYQDKSGSGFDIFMSLIIVCPFIFIFFIKASISSKNKSIALYSSAIYFTHLFVVNILKENFDLKGTSLTFITLTLSVFVSYFIIKLNKKLKFIL